MKPVMAIPGPGLTLTTRVRKWQVSGIPSQLCLPGTQRQPRGSGQPFPGEGKPRLVSVCVQLYGEGRTPPAISSSPARQRSQKHRFCGNHVTQRCGPWGVHQELAAAPPEATPLFRTPRG